MTDRLTRDDWIREGFRTLAADGSRGLKVGAMSERLKVSRGSFYWHFADVARFLDALLAHWKCRATDDVIEAVGEKAGPDRLPFLLKRAFSQSRALDRAMRSWAAEASEVATVVTAVDAVRVAYIADLLIEAGVASHCAKPRAAFIYWAYLGQTFVIDPDHAVLDEAAVADIGALFERG